MRRVYSAFAIAAVVIVLMVVGSWMVDNTLDAASTLLQQAQSLSHQGEYKKADEMYRRLLKGFEERQRTLGFFLKHDILSELSSALHGVSPYNDQEHQAELDSETQRALDRIRTARVLFFSVC